ERYGGRANYVRILHADGTMALYAHLKPEGVLVRVGQRVRQGQQIALSGNTGFSTAPHLHFVVQANRGMRLESVPFRMYGALGELKFGTGPALAADGGGGPLAPAGPGPAVPPRYNHRLSVLPSASRRHPPCPKSQPKPRAGAPSRSFRTPTPARPR